MFGYTQVWWLVNIVHSRSSHLGIYGRKKPPIPFESFGGIFHWVSRQVGSIANVQVAVTASQLTYFLKDWTALVKVMVKTHDPAWIVNRQNVKVCSDSFIISFFNCRRRIDVTVKSKNYNFLVSSSPESIHSASCLWECNVVGFIFFTVRCNVDSYCSTIFTMLH